ncbi:DMT family transporter [Fictibacillus iocasae]|uniref:DMT family transporter n=1 Tax=Fictibacillus iocasae TaxID=2715437 RepID=A0ABW2NSG0_9BACL
MKKYYAYLVLANLFWAGNYVFAKSVVIELSPVQLTFLRWLIAVFLLFPAAHFVEKPNWRLVWREWKTLLVMSLLGIIGYNTILYEALQHTSSMNAALVNSLNPALLVLFSFLLLKERISKANIVGLLISLAGVLFVLTDGHLLRVFSIDYNKGDLFMLLAILVWTMYSIIGRRLRGTPPIAATAVSVALGLCTLLPFFLVDGVPQELSGQAAAGLMYIALFPSVGSYLLWNTAIRRTGPGRAGIYLNLITVFTAVLSIMLGKSITAVQVLGGVLVFAGVYLASRKNKSSPATSKKVFTS